MIKLSNSNMIKTIIKLLILFVIAKSLSLLMWWFLPSDGVELQAKNNYKPKYQRVDFKNMLESSVEYIKPNIKSKSNGISITNMVLKGLYGVGSTGFAIVALKKSPNKTTIVSVGEEFSGYTLKAILSSSIVFIKSAKEYVLKMENSKADLNKSFISPASNDDSPKSVSRSDIGYYAKDPAKIWKDISIVEFKNGNKIEGFKVTKVKKGTKMESLGLKRGDVIIKANNVDLNSYKDVLDIYNKIDKLDEIQIVVMRNNQEKELVYEIN